MNENETVISQYFPKHFIHPTNERVYFSNWINSWWRLIGNLRDRPNIIGIEIGTNYGGCATWCLENILTGDGSHLYTIDVNENEYIISNLKPYKNVTFIKDLSENVLKNLNHNGNEKLFADFIYVDGCHFSKYVLEDIVLSWPLLKYDGIMMIDDYGWGIHTTDERVKPKIGIDAFLNAYDGHYELIQLDWQVYLKKINHEYSEVEIKGNGSFLKNEQ
jgi:cephalosporin hydroxylase